MNDIQILERLAATDAYAPETDMPLSAWSREVAFSEVERKIGVPVRQTGTPRPLPRLRHRGWLIAAAAFAAVILVIGAVTLLIPTADELPPATTPPTTEVLSPTTVAVEEAVEEVTATTAAPLAEVEPVMDESVVALLDRYEETFNTGDEETFRSFFADGYWRADPGSTEWRQSVDYMVNMMTNSRIQGTTLSIEKCTRTDDGAQCKFVYAGLVEEALYFGPIKDSVTVFIADDEITHMLITEWETGDMQERNSQKVLDWVEENFPEDRPKMAMIGIGVINDHFGRDPIEVVELWAKYVPMWAEAGRP